MTIYHFLSSVLFAVIITAIVIYKIKQKSPRFRVIRTTVNKVDWYNPQVRLSGVWFYIMTSQGISPYLNIFVANTSFLDPHDALDLIDKFKSAGNYTIPSNRKLNPNEKAISVE
jgi:hypothetical protein